jgi:glycosyltransferase involved in cell wall biosynthesis
MGWSNARIHTLFIMTVWINNPFDFLPGEGARLQRYGLLCNALAQEGHQVIWWTSDWNHIKKARREKQCANARMGEVEIRLIKTLSYQRNVSLRRLLSHWLYAKRWERMALAEPERPDLILCSTPPLSTGWVMQRLCKRFACPGVIDVMDLWPETFERVVPSWMLWPLRWMARRVYQGADAISAVGDSYLEEVRAYLDVPRRMRECANGKPMYRCYHGIEVKKCANARVRECGNETACQGTAGPGGDGTLRLVYVGNMGKGYDLETLVRAVSEMRREGVAITLDLAGSGEQEPCLKFLAQGNPEAITFHGVLTGDPLAELLSQSDVGVIPMVAQTRVAVPYKLADYAAHALPVISSLTGETAELLERYDCGWHYQTGSVASLKQALIAAWRLKQEEALSFGERCRNARRMAEELFDAERMYPVFVRWLLRPHSGRNEVNKSGGNG